MHRHTTLDPGSDEGTQQLINLFLGQSTGDIRRKLQKIRGPNSQNLETLLDEAWRVLGYKNSPAIFGEQLAKDLESWEPPPGEGYYSSLQGYQVSQKKAQMVWQTVIYLGYKVSAGQTTLGRDLKEAICQTPKPQTVKELRTFLGMTGWCRLWIYNYGLLVKPLYALFTEGSRDLQWTKDATRAFDQLKKALMSAPALGLPNVSKPFFLFSHEKWGIALGILAQNLGPYRRAVAYLSKQLDTAAKGWPGCLRAVAAVAINIQEAHKFTLGQKMTVLVSHTMSAVLEAKGGHWLSPQRFLKYQAILVEQDDVEILKVEIIALIRALELAKGKEINIYTDSRVVHAHGAIWKERGLLNSQGKSIKHAQEILRLLDAIRLLEKVAIMHIKAHQKVSSELEEGNMLADREAKEAAKGEVPDKAVEAALIPDGKVSIEGKPMYNKKDKKLIKVCTEYHKNQTKISPPVPRKAVNTKMPAIPEVEEQITPVVTKIGPYAIKKTGVQKLIVNPKWSLKRVEMGVQLMVRALQISSSSTVVLSTTQV
ncbi:hypothetical protein DUI87_03451 [Hirundo rustica rustica]|uniref:RNase H type-1 domain-containing protein n=1 Tax=Hirundo rustica rustica TaxID=333673 RepID=A0A3M0L3A3_HIRRU|nr:hypothetical protein DUI87_03451 [Hirundo rustica rustica]